MKFHSVSIQKNPSFFVSVRFLIAVVAFLGYGVLQMQRTITSIAIVCMVNSTALKEISDLKRNVTTGTYSAHTSSNSSTNHPQCQPRQSSSKSTFVSCKLQSVVIISVGSNQMNSNFAQEWRVCVGQGNSYVNFEFSLAYLGNFLKIC